MKNYLLLLLIFIVSMFLEISAQRIEEFPPYFTHTDNRSYGGRVHSITVNPVINDEIIAVHEFGGLWKTLDRGNYWFHLDGLTTIFIRNACYSPDGNTVIATLEKDLHVNNNGGIWKSSDGGNSWFRPGNFYPPTSARIPERISAYGVSYAPDSANKVYVGTDYGIAISRDNGSTWTHQMLENISPIQWDRKQNAVFSVKALSNRRVIVTTRTGIYLGDENGSSNPDNMPVWTNIRPGNFIFREESNNIDVSPLDNNKVFIFRDYTHLLLFDVSTNHWTEIPLPVRGDNMYGRGPFIKIGKPVNGGSNAIEIWLGQGNKFFKTILNHINEASGISVSSWVELTQGLHADAGALALGNNFRPILYGCDGGLFKPTNNEATQWTGAAIAYHGMNSFLITDLDGTNYGRLNSNGSSFYFGTQDNSLWSSTDDGLTWPNQYSDCCEGFHIETRKDALAQGDVTVTYGTVGSGYGIKMSGANFTNKRSVPDLLEDGTRLKYGEHAFLISPNNYIRFCVPPDRSLETYVSTNNCTSWRKKASVSLQRLGVFQVSNTLSGPVAYAAFKGLRRYQNKDIIGLMRFDDLLSRTTYSYTNRNLIYLPDNGSFGQRATEFDWHAVFGVDPNNSQYLIAPDIYNNVVKCSRDGGRSWYTDDNLTREVTRNNKLLLYGNHPYLMQVTEIAFDPYNPSRILVGTRDAGIIMSEDGGNSWSTIPYSENITYITGFFFKRDNTVIVSSYGRGLWKLTLPSNELTIPYNLYCLGSCIHRSPFDDRILPDPADWNSRNIILFYNGRVNGIALSDGKIKMLTVTPGTYYKSFLGNAAEDIQPYFKESKTGVGFSDLKGCVIAEENKEIIKGIIFEGEKIAGIISGYEEFNEELKQFPKEYVKEDISEPNLPYLSLSTTLPSSGTPVVGEDGIVNIEARNFIYNSKTASSVYILLDENTIEKRYPIRKDGVVKYQVKVSAELGLGKHTIKLVQNINGNNIYADGEFIKSAIDNFEK
ncbi:MAG: hypothetical protein Q8N83_13000 [Ignavibacteria bacterium]|nr:hypothetical protein [Ignavibacteria bacterium]